MSKRRNLLALIGTVVLLLSLAIPLAQCAPAAEEEVTPPPEEEVTPPPEEEEVTPAPEEGEIKYGGRLNVGWNPGYGLENLRVTSAWKYTAMGCDFWPLVYDQLWIIGPPPDYKILPRLATSWDMEDGGKSWVFHLRHEGVFHDGVPVTAEDVAFTMKYLPKADPAFSGTFGNDNDPEVAIIDDYTVRITFDNPAPQKPDAAYFVPILPKHIWEPYKDNMTAFDNAEAIGSGPFKVKEFKPAQYIWFEANEDYWGGRPYVDEVVYKVYGSFDALNMAMKSGEIDMIGYSGCSALAVDELEAAENVKVIRSPGIGMVWLSFNLHKEGPIQDLDVRKAIMYAMDRDRMIEMVSLGYSEKADSWIYPELPEHNPNLPQYDFDLEKANALLDGAGYVDSDGDGIRNDPATGHNME
ncbi:MAG: peptide ABC transporter substrate-binding protein, partial [Dehalococcoidia bacterium]|nr:peptide ABC transporter substrate-binding protein [Dehalococcoidia bacterium]